MQDHKKLRERVSAFIQLRFRQNSVSIARRNIQFSHASMTEFISNG